jgi:hypothetical protein
MFVKNVGTKNIGIWVNNVKETLEEAVKIVWEY